MPRGKTCRLDPGTVCRSSPSRESHAKRKSRCIRHLSMACAVARGLLARPRDHLDEHMIAQPLLTTPTAKAQAHQHQSTAQQPSQQNAGGFPSLLSMTDSSLTDLAHNTGASATSPQPANANKKNNNDQTPTPYVPAPNQPAQTPASQSGDGNQDSANAANAAANNAAGQTRDAGATDRSCHHCRMINGIMLMANAAI